MEEGKRVKNMWQQLQKGRHIIRYKKPKEIERITKRDIVLTIINMFNEYTMPYTKNIVTTEEDLDNEVSHFYFLNKYNLL